LIDPVENAISIFIERTPHRIHLGAGGSIAAVIVQIGDAVTIGVVQSATCRTVSLPRLRRPGWQRIGRPNPVGVRIAGVRRRRSCGAARVRLTGGRRAIRLSGYCQWIRGRRRR